MSALAYRFAVWIVAVLFVFGVLNVKGDIAPDITVISYPDDNLVYADPMEYQRTKRSDIHDGDTGVSDDDDDEIGDEGFDEEDEDDEDSSESLTNSPGGSNSSVVHKKDEIHQMNEKPVQQQQPASIDDDYDDDDEERSSDEAGSSAGSPDDSEGSAGESGSAEVRSQSFYARQHVSNNEEDANDDASADKDEIDGSSDIDGGQKKRIDSEEKKPTVSVRRSKPRNLIKMVLEESKHAEQQEKLERENDEENSGLESGSSASFVQDSGVKEVYHGEDTAKENETEPLHNETHLHPKLLNNSSNERSVTIKSKAEPEVNKNDTKSKLQKDTALHKEKAKDEVRPKPQVQQVHHVEQLHHVHKPEHVRKKSAKKASIGVSKVSHLAKKRLHNKYMTAHVTHAHVTKSHPRIVHKKPVNKGSSQMCHSDRILAGHSLKGGTRAGHFDSLGETASMHACLQRCCSKHTCDVALLVDGSCFGVACYSKELCEPIPVPHPHFVSSQLGFISKGQKRGDIEKNKEFHCQYGNLTLRNNEQWSGELCGGVVTCKDGIATVKKCPGIPPKPDDCTKPRLVVKHRNGECCQMKWKCKARHCTFNNRLIKHGYTLSDPLCTGVVSCYNGQLHMDYCPKIPEKPKDCARPKLKTISVPGKCCKKLWVCSDKSCKYDGLKLSHGEKLTDASCAVVMECRNGFLHDKQCPGPPPVPHICINPSLKVKRIPGECCEMNWTCDIS